MILKNVIEKIFYKNYKNKIKKYKNNKMKKLSLNFFPKTKEELQQIIKSQIKKFGNKVNLNNIDISQITDMSLLFEHSKFNGNISKWDVSNVINMNSMFNSSIFNNDISNWNVSNVTTMQGMFQYSKFNRNICRWFIKLNKQCNLNKFGILNNIKINSYENFKLYHRQKILYNLSKRV